SEWKNERCSLEWTVEKISASITSTSMKQYTHDRLHCLSTVSLKTLRVSVTPSKHLLFRLRVLARRTDATAYGLLPTPISFDRHGKKQGRKDSTADKGGGKHSITLMELAAKKLLTTPRVSTNRMTGRVTD